MNFDAMKRRQFLKTGAATAGTLLAGSLMSSPAWAAYPDRNIDVIVPTRAGGGADRLLRAVSSVWKNHLNTNFEPGFFPGASGRVGYEVYMGKYQPDAYSLIFGNMGPEVLNWAVKRQVLILMITSILAVLTPIQALFLSELRANFNQSMISLPKAKSVN